MILDVGNGIKGGSPEHPQFVSQLRFNHHELYGNGWLAGTHSVFRYKNYVFVGDEVFPGRSSIFTTASASRCAASCTWLMLPTSITRAKLPNIRCRKPARTICGSITTLCTWAITTAAAASLMFQANCAEISTGRVVRLVGSGPAIRRAIKPNLPFTWGAQPHNGLIYFNDVHSGIWIVKLGEPTEKGSTTAPGQ